MQGKAGKGGKKKGRGKKKGKSQKRTFPPSQLAYSPTFCVTQPTSRAVKYAPCRTMVLGALSALMRLTCGAVATVTEALLTRKVAREMLSQGTKFAKGTVQRTLLVWCGVDLASGFADVFDRGTWLSQVLMARELLSHPHHDRTRRRPISACCDVCPSQYWLRLPSTRVRT